MNPFFFKLEPVLAYRKLLEDGEKRKLKDIHTSILATQQLEVNLGIEIGDYGRTLEERTRGSIDMEQVRHVDAYLGKLRNDLVLASKFLLRLRQDWRFQVEKLMEARRKREVVEKLKTKGFKLHQKALQVLEDKLHDELSVTQFGRLSKQNLPSGESDA